MWPAVVVDNKDGDGNPGYRVKLKLSWLSEHDTTFWARIAVPMGGSGRGTYMLPEINDQVLVVFEHGEVCRPIVIGALWSKKQEPVEVNQSGKNNTKLIKSRCGHRIVFDDKEGAERITIVDRTTKNKIVLDSPNKLVKIESGGDIEIKAKASVILHANALKIGTSDGVNGKGASLLVHAAKTFSLKATDAITIGGGYTTINTSSAAACSVSGSGAGELGVPGAEQPKDQVVERASNAAGGAGDGLSGSSAGSSSDRSSGRTLASASAGANNPDVRAPQPRPEPEVSNVRWSRGRVRVGETVQAVFTVRSFAGGEAATVKIYEYDGGSRSKTTLVGTVHTTVNQTDGEVIVDWSRDAAAAEADLAEDHSDGDNTPLEYHFEVEAGGLRASASGPLWLTNTVVVAMRYRDGSVIEDGVQVSLSSADGQSMTAKTAGGEARFEDVVIGPIHIVHDFA